MRVHPGCECPSQGYSLVDPSGGACEPHAPVVRLLYMIRGMCCMGLLTECEDSVQQAAVCFGRHFVCPSLWANSQKRKK